MLLSLPTYKSKIYMNNKISLTDVTFLLQESVEGLSTRFNAIMNFFRFLKYSHSEISYM